MVAVAGTADSIATVDLPRRRKMSALVPTAHPPRVAATAFSGAATAVDVQ